MAAVVVPHYQYKQFTLEDEIRVLNLRPGSPKDPLFFSIKHEVLPDCPCSTERILPRPTDCQKCQNIAEHSTFEALSYTWGNTDLLETVYCESSDKSEGTRSMLVTVNCASALKRLRDTRHWRKLWVDAICIDQSNRDERSAQVRIMRRMYTVASQVIVHLGDSTPSSNRAITILENETSGLAPLNTDELSPKDVLCIQELVARQWFHRVWVMQEIASARSAIVVCGDRTTNWNFAFHRNMESWLGYCPHIGGFPHVMSFGPSWVAKNEFSPNKLFDQLCKTRACGATEPHDKVYAVLSLFRNVPSNKELEIDYSRSTVALFTAVAEYLLHLIGPVVLEQVSNHSNIAGLPSWVPDWTIGRFAKLPSPHSSHSSSPDVIAENPQQSCATSPQHSPVVILPSKTIGVQAIRVDFIQTVGSQFSGSTVKQWQRETLGWMKMIEKALFSQPSRANQPSHLWDDVVVQFFNTINPLILDHCQSRPSDIGAYANTQLLWKRFRLWCFDTPDLTSKMTRQMEDDDIDCDLFWVDWPKAAMQSVTRCIHRSLFISCNLQLTGLGANDIAEGDEIFRFRGRESRSDIYYILRPSTMGSYKFIGDCIIGSGNHEVERSNLETWETITIL